MFSLFGKSKRPPTLKARVEAFWDWYAGVADRFYATIEAKKISELVPEVSAQVDKIWPGLAWVFGPGAEGKGHSFTLSGEGVIYPQLVTLYWLSRARSLPGWTFYSARQPSKLPAARIEIREQKFDAAEIWIAPRINRERQKIDIVAWHPLFTNIGRESMTVLYLFLDEALGEYGTEGYLGAIETGDQKLADSIPLSELPDFVRATVAQEDWKFYPPGECYTGYKGKPHDEFLRGDVIAGTTSCFKLVNAYLGAKGELADPLASSGADFIFVSFDGSILPQGGQVAARGEIEEALDAALKAEASGQVLGGALGTSNAYIDIMIFDGANSIEIVKKVMKGRNLPVRAEIHYFAKEKKGHRIVV